MNRKALTGILSIPDPISLSFDWNQPLEAEKYQTYHTCIGILLYFGLKGLGVKGESGWEALLARLSPRERERERERERDSLTTV